MSQTKPAIQVDQVAEEIQSTITQLIRQLDDFAKDDLRREWSDEFHPEPPPDFSRDLLVRTLAWRIQEKAHGGHDKDVIRLLNDYARGRVNEPLFGRLKSGTVVIREYQGVRHAVTVAKDGFIWREQTYANLSVIARLITGTNWNGPRFFGLRENERKSGKSREGRK